MREKRSSIEYLSNEEIWLDPSYKIHSLGGEEIRSLGGGADVVKEVAVRNRLEKGSEEHGSFLVSETPAGISGSGKCSVMILFPGVLNAEWTDDGSPRRRKPPVVNAEKVFVTQAAIELIRHHPLSPQIDYLLELPIRPQ